MTRPSSNGHERRFIVGFDLGGTLVAEAFPNLHPIPESFASQSGVDQATLTKGLFEVIGSLMQENNRRSSDQVPAREIIERWVARSLAAISADTLERAAWHLLGGDSSTYLTPLPHAVALLRALTGAGATMIALSNTALPVSIVEQIFAVHGIDGYFSAVVLSSECGWRKPSPRAFEALERSIGLTDNDAMVFVGNSFAADVAPAIERGYMAAYINRPEDPADDPATLEPTPSLSATTLPELEIQLLDQIDRWRRA